MVETKQKSKQNIFYKNYKGTLTPFGAETLMSFKKTFLGGAYAVRGIYVQNFIFSVSM
jgi:hypothetical protein